MLLSRPGPGLGGAAILASGTPAQKEKWLKRYEDGTVRFGAMALTESNAGSDVSAIETTAVLQGDHWVLNGTKIFCTNGASADVVVVWATLDKSKGKDGIRAFIVGSYSPSSIARINPSIRRLTSASSLRLAACPAPASACSRFHSAVNSATNTA